MCTLLAENVLAVGAEFQNLISLALPRKLPAFITNCCSIKQIVRMFHRNYVVKLDYVNSNNVCIIHIQGFL